MKTKLCSIYNFAPRYRESIFRKIDETFDCHWYFGTNETDIKGMDLSLLKDVETAKAKELGGGWYWQPGVVGMLKRNCSNYILLGESRALSTWAFCLLARLFYPKKKVFVWTHGWYGKETLIERLIKKMEFHLPNGGVFTYGHYARNLMIKEGFSPNKLFVIHNSLDYDRQLSLRQQMKPSTVYRDHFGNDHKTIVFIGRLTAQKRIDMLLRAVARLREQGEEYNVALVGDGAARQELEAMARTLQVETWFYGACYDEAANAELIYNADLCVSPGNVGLTAIHTMMFGTPVITHSDFPYQMPEFEAIIEGRTGSFFKHNDTEALAATISRWFAEHGNKREEVRQACYDVIDTSWTPEYQLSVIKAVIKP